MKPKILIVDDEEGMRVSLSELLQSDGYLTVPADSADNALSCLHNENPDFAIVDVRMPKRGGLDLLRDLRSASPNLKIFMMTAYPSVETAVLAMKCGAVDFFTKPLDFARLREELYQYSKMILDTPNHNIRQMPPDMLYGGSLAILKLKETIERIAPTDAPVIITGESGTGKELVAEAIHCRSLRSQFPFKKINCAAIPDSLLESELFGYEKGAFTGAQSRKVGLFESANTGTVFLDEIGDMDIRLQSKLLRILQGGDFRRVGGTEDLHVNIRIISATNQNLPDLIHKGQFREDLFYRLSVISVNTPPLREHIEDIPLLVKKFVADFCRAYNKKEPIVDEQFLDILRAQTWPGNVRELKNCIERAIIFCDGQRLGPEHLPEQYKTHLCKNDISPEHEKSSINEAYQDLQRKMIMDALSKTNGNKTQAAKLLKIPRRTLYNKLNKIGFVNDERY